MNNFVHLSSKMSLAPLECFFSNEYSNRGTIMLHYILFSEIKHCFSYIVHIWFNVYKRHYRTMTCLYLQNLFWKILKRYTSFYFSKILLRENKDIFKFSHNSHKTHKTEVLLFNTKMSKIFSVCNNQIIYILVVKQ
jgi:hypothetical protein